MGAFTITLPKGAGAKVARGIESWEQKKRQKVRAAILETTLKVSNYAKLRFEGNIEGDTVSPPVPTSTFRAMTEARAELGISGEQDVPYPRPHVRTGILRTSIETKWKAPLRSAVSANAPYAKFVEFGTSRSRPHPFMTPAAESERKHHRDRIRKAYR